MDKVSRIDGKEYTLIEQLPALVGEAGYVICEDTEGKRFVCPEELWLENVPQTEQAAPVCTHKLYAGENRVLSFHVPWQGGAVCKALLQHQNRKERLYAGVQKRVGTGAVR